MSFSIQFIIGIVASFLFIASAVALYFALNAQYAIPLLLVAIVNLGAVIFLVFLITRGIVSPLNRIKTVLKKIGEGDLSLRINLFTTKEVRELGLGVNEMIVRLQEARAHEEQVERLKTEFVSMAAHQLRSPLATVKWAFQEFLTGDLGELTLKQKDFMNKSYEVNERMITLVNDLLNVTKIEEGKYLYNQKPVQINSIVTELIQWYAGEAKRRGVELIFENTSALLLYAMADGEKLRVAIQNIIDNALQYTKQGGSVRVLLKHDTKNAEIVVQDTGIGIPEKEQERVFQRFFRAENAKRTETQGTGLGLYLAKNIIEAHGGEIRFHTKENQGTIFTLTIPLVSL